MPCEHYKKILIDAAISHDPLPLDLRTHLHSCPSCRTTFDDHRRVLAAIDSGLRVAANAPVPPSLLPAVHLRLAQGNASGATAKRFQSANWIYVTAAASLIFALIPFLRPRSIHEPLAQARTETITASASIGEGPASGEQSTVPGRAVKTPPQFAPSIDRYSNARLHPPTHAVRGQAMRSSPPEVLVPPEERIALAEFVSRAHSRKSLIVPPAVPPAAMQAKPLAIEPMQIAELEVPSLEELHRQTDGEIQTR